jgi:ethanolamine ammonia-lyase small subunit
MPWIHAMTDDDTSANEAVSADPWSNLARFTPAPIALGRAGASLPTQACLRFALAHARARDAVHTPFDAESVARAVRDLGFDTALVESTAASREIYLRRPDLGRRLSERSREDLAARAQASCDLAVVVADGLSSAAIHAHAVPLLAELRPWIEQARWRVTPVVVAQQARVALGDEIGALLRARAVAVLIGERPGLSSPDSLGIYLTYAPRRGRTDAERNCISNVRREGLAPATAAFKLHWLLVQALARQLTGVGLKDESDRLLAHAPSRDDGGASPPARISE